MTDLDAVAARLPVDEPLVVVHQVVVGYVSTRARAKFRRKVHELASRRSVYWLFAESPAAVETLAGLEAPPWDRHVQHTLVLVDLTRDSAAASTLAVADPHGRWLRWLDSPMFP